MKTPFYFLALFSLAIAGSCRDSLENNVFEKDIESKIIQLSEAAKANIGDIEKAQQYAQEMLALAQEVEANKYIGDAYNIMGSINRNKENYVEALRSFLGSAQAFELANDTIGMTKAYNNLGNLYKDIQKYDKAIDYYQKSLTLHTLTKDRAGMAITSRNMALVYQNMENFEEAKDRYWSSLYIWKRLGDEKRMAQLYNDLSITYDLVLSNDIYMDFEAEKQITLNLNLNALKYYQKINDVNGLAKAYINIGKIYAYQESDIPLQYFNKVLSLPLDQLAKKFLVIAHNNIGLMMLHRKENQLAADHFLKAEEYSSNEDSSLITYEKLALLLEEQGNLSQAIVYYKKLNDLVRKIKFSQQSEELAKAETRYAIEYAGL